jgi:hypothetical protein
MKKSPAPPDAPACTDPTSKHVKIPGNLFDCRGFVILLKILRRHTRCGRRRPDPAKQKACGITAFPAPSHRRDGNSAGQKVNISFIEKTAFYYTIVEGAINFYSAFKISRRLPCRRIPLIPHKSGIRYITQKNGKAPAVFLFAGRTDHCL